MSGFSSGIAAGLNLLAAYTPTAAQDVVGVFDNDYNQLFPLARPVKLTAKETAKLMEHPLENGATITDHRIFLPDEIELSLIMDPSDYVNTYNDVRTVYKGDKTIIVQTNVGLYPSLLIKSMPHEENPEHFDTITMILSLKEVQLAKAQTSSPLATQNSGSKSGKPATTSQTEQTGEKVQHSSAAYSLIYGKPATTSHPE